jgi:hypothetical protein
MSIDIATDEWLEYERAHQRTMRTNEELRYATLFPGTAMGIRAELLLGVPHVTEVTVGTIGPGVAVVELELPMWAWLALGIIHLVARRRAARLLKRCAPAKVLMRIRTATRRNASPAMLPAAAARTAQRVH